MPVTVAVSGASGRLGTLVCRVVEDLSGFTLCARLTSASPADEGAAADILFDVSHPAASPEIVERALRRGQRVIVGTSGWSADRLAVLQRVVDELPGSSVIVIPNFSLGSVLGTALATIAAPYFGSVEIIESHHPQKIDSPSGTAVRTAELIAAARSTAGQQALAAPFTEQRARGEAIAGVPVHSLRQSGVLARQEVRFGGTGETLTVSHDTISDESYLAGIRATLQASGQLSGLHIGLENVLGLRFG